MNNLILATRTDRVLSQRFLAERLWPIALLFVMELASSDLSAQENRPTSPTIQYRDDFASATGGRQIQVNGLDPTEEGDVHSLMYSYGRPHRNAPGTLRMIMMEDGTARGPDGRPGVLRMELADVPIATDYAGFVVTGHKELGAVKIPAWTPGQVTAADLDRTFISFRFRTENLRTPHKGGVTLNFRFEPDQEGSYIAGANFGALIALDNWRTMIRPIGSAKNVDAFLSNLNYTQPEQFKLVWAQAGPIELYQPGDSVLIDDLTIIVRPSD
ncbi:MAG: hypothetical protein KF861_17960 [Planctomycetaceae bacterium]|nr:hypothetical protein [Planctomycetaceae bacterium]